MPEIKFNWPVIGHRKIIDFLQNCIKNDNLAPAYLFSGMEHLGKRLVVDCFVLSLICERQIDGPCFKCVSCQQYIKGIHPDIIQTKIDEDRSAITVEQIRELRKKLSLHAISIRQKISLIEPAEAMNAGASNALLKILEEPLGPTVHILISHESDSLLSTIKSRCQIIKLLPVAKNVIESYIKKNFGENKADEIASLSMGRPGIALRFSREKATLNHYSEESSAFLKLLGENIARRIKILAEYLGKEYSYGQLVKISLGLLNNWQRVIRDLILIKEGSKNRITNINLFSQLEKTAEKISLARALMMHHMIKDARRNIKLNVNPKLVLENFLINI